MTRKKTTPAATPPRGDPSHRDGPAADSWLLGRRPILRFVGVFAALIIPATIFYYGYFKETDIYRSYLCLNADASAAVLRLLGTPARANGISVRAETPAFGLTVAQGCDAIQPAMLFLCAVLASPVALKAKWPGILIGVPLLLLLNLTRIITLFYIGAYFPNLFEIMHIDVWQALFIALALFFWLTWASWVKKRRTPRVSAQA